MEQRPSWICPICKTENTTSFCFSCGHRVGESVQKKEDTQPVQQSPMVNNPFFQRLFPTVNPNAAHEIKKLMKHPETHGPLLKCSYSASSNGMMYNSNTLHSISVSKEGDKQIIQLRDKEAFQDATGADYLASGDVLGELKAFIDRENFAAFAALEDQKSPGPVMDYSSSSSITLRFDDSPVGGSPFTYITIRPSALRWNGVGHLADELNAILNAAVENAALIPPPEGSWTCKNCGTPGNTGDKCAGCPIPKQ